MTKQGQTTNYKASDHLIDLEKYLRKRVDVIVINNGTIPKRIIQYYHQFGEKVVEDDLKEDLKVFREDLIARVIYNKNKADQLTRSILRHDPKKISQLLWRIIRR